MSLLALPAYVLSFLPASLLPSSSSSASNPSEAETLLPNPVHSFKTIFPPDHLHDRGLCFVHPEGHEIYYELHGTGPRKVMFIMGLSNTSFSWSRQIKHFTSRPHEFSLLVFDNRGSGYSGYPTGRWTTSSMARDTRGLLDHVGWTGEKEVHVVGISMGGMISLELARLIPERILSLTLCVTSSGHGIWRNLPPAKGFETMRKLLFLSEPLDRIGTAVEMLYPTSWLAKVDPDDVRGRTNRETRVEEYTTRYSLTKQQQLSGNLAQSIACLTHHVPPSSLAQIGRDIGRVCVLVGDDDAMVDVANSSFLFSHISPSPSGEGNGEEGEGEEVEGGRGWSKGGVELVRWDETGHAIHLQWPDRFNRLVERVWTEAEEQVPTPRQAFARSE